MATHTRGAAQRPRTAPPRTRPDCSADGRRAARGRHAWPVPGRGPRRRGRRAQQYPKPQAPHLLESCLHTCPGTISISSLSLLSFGYALPALGFRTQEWLTPPELTCALFPAAARAAAQHCPDGRPAGRRAPPLQSPLRGAWRAAPRRAAAAAEPQLSGQSASDGTRPQKACDSDGTCRLAP
ncbi:MAG: hypothetical protein J3K34DRAFT_187024 [Monoraphidium minutum]|nr:MAG: hypothetical protein J3K34DRAFT_187024 [Monoraphidium minutum]